MKHIKVDHDGTEYDREENSASGVKYYYKGDNLIKVVYKDGSYSINSDWWEGNINFRERKCYRSNGKLWVHSKEESRYFD